MREKMIEKLEQSLANDRNGREMRFVGGNVIPVIANGVTFAEDINVPSKWISVKDRLPDALALEKVLCYGHRGRVFVGQYFGQSYTEGVAQFSNTERGYCQGATHWMPLPEPPEGE